MQLVPSIILKSYLSFSASEPQKFSFHAFYQIKRVYCAQVETKIDYVTVDHLHLVLEKARKGPGKHPPSPKPGLKIFGPE